MAADGPFHGGGAWLTVSPGYFEVFKIPVKRGRSFTERDDAQRAPVAIVNQAFARKYFPGERVLGKKLKPGGGNGKPGGPPWREIVGVVARTRSAICSAC